MAKSINGDATDDDTTPICRCRVLYLGSAVPHITKDGLQGIQEPLRDLYPEQGVLWTNGDSGGGQMASGIDSWLSVWSNGILVENADDKGNTVRRFHPIESLHYCAAVRYVSVPADSKDTPTAGSANGNGRIAKFLPLDSPFTRHGLMDMLSGNNGHPPLFACILRRTTGIKVLECHAFICKKEAAANALVRCCFHAYADTMHARQIELESPYEQLDKRRSRSIGSALDSASLIDEKINNWQKTSNSGGSGSGTPEEVNGSGMLARQKARTPSMISLVSHTLPDGAGPGGNPIEPIYYSNTNGNGTLRSVRSFISLATLKGNKKYQQQQQQRTRQMPPMAPMPLPPPPVMFATLSKKELKKVLKKESTLKRKHKYKDFPGPFLAPNGMPIIYGPPPPPPGAMYAPLPPPGSYLTLSNRKGRMLPPPLAGPHGSMMHHMQAPPPGPGHMIGENGFHHPPAGMLEQEPIYMSNHAVAPSPSGTLRRAITPHGEPIYGDGRILQGPLTQPPGSMMPLGPQPIYLPHPQTGIPIPMMPTLSRKELKELEKQKQAMRKAEKQMLKKEAKKIKKSGVKMPLPPQPNGQVMLMNEGPEMDLYQPKPFELEAAHVQADEMMLMAEMHQQQAALAANGYANGSTNGGGGIYKKKGHLNERAFSYSIRQEHRSRSNSISNLTFENGQQHQQQQQQPVPMNARNGHDPSIGSSLVNLKVENRNSGQQQHMHSNSVPNFLQQSQQQPPYMNGNGRPMTESNGSLHNMSEGAVDPNMLAHRMYNLKLNGHANGGPPPPPPPPLPMNGHQFQFQKIATIKRL